MTDLPEPQSKRADQLVVGDRIAAKQLPFAGAPGQVLLVCVHYYQNTTWVFAAYATEDGYHDSVGFLPETDVYVYPPADPSGLAYSRADDADTVALPGRVPPQTGAVTDDGLVEEKPGWRDESTGLVSGGLVPDCPTCGGAHHTVEPCR